MNARTPKLLFDIERAAESTAQFTEGLEFSDYKRNDMVKFAVERQVGIVGNALRLLRQADAELAARIADDLALNSCCERVMSAIPAEIDDAEVWRIVQTSLPVLHVEVHALLATVEEP